jgi:hypothetical protein
VASQVVLVFAHRGGLADADENIAVEGPRLESALASQLHAAMRLVAFVLFKVFDKLLDFDFSLCKWNSRLRTVRCPAVVDVAKPNVKCEGRNALEIVVFWDLVKVRELVVPARVFSVIVEEENKNLKSKMSF